MRRVLSPAALAAAIVTATGLVISSGAETPQQQVAHRQEQMKTFGRNVRTIANFLQKGEGSMSDVQASARTMDEVAQNLLTLFPEGTGIGVSDSEARPVIWSDWAAFTEVASNARTQIAALRSAAESGDPGAVRTQFAAVGRACATCHDTYRAE